MEQPTLETTLRAAERLSHIGKLDQAIALLEPALVPPFSELDEPRNTAVFLLSGLYLITEQFSLGERLVEAALQVARPEQQVDLHRRRSHFYVARGHVNKAKQELVAVAALEETLESPLTRAYAQVLRLSLGNDLEETYRAILDALEQFPQDRVGSSALTSAAACVSFDAGRYDDTFRWASKTLAHPHATPAELTEALRLKGQVALVNGHVDEALDRLKEATYLARRGADWQTATELALICARALLLQGAVTAAEALAQELGERFPTTRAQAGSLQVFCACARGDLATAEAALQRAKEATRRDQLLAAAQGSLAYEKGDSEQVLHTLVQQLRSASGVRAQLLRLAQVPLLWETGQQEKAEEERAALTTLHTPSGSREQQSAFFRMEAQLAYRKRHWSEGIAAWKQVLRLEPHRLKLAESWTLLGDGYSAEGEPTAARFAWERAAAQPSESIWVRRAKERLEAS